MTVSATFSSAPRTSDSLSRKLRLVRSESRSTRSSSPFFEGGDEEPGEPVEVGILCLVREVGDRDQDPAVRAGDRRRGPGMAQRHPGNHRADEGAHRHQRHGRTGPGSRRGGPTLLPLGRRRSLDPLPGQVECPGESRGDGKPDRQDGNDRLEHPVRKSQRVLHRLDYLKDREGEQAPCEQRTDDAPSSQLLEPGCNVHGVSRAGHGDASRTRHSKSHRASKRLETDPLATSMTDWNLGRAFC